jgi:hypothetical protein
VKRRSGQKPNEGCRDGYQKLECAAPSCLLQHLWPQVARLLDYKNLSRGNGGPFIQQEIAG